MLNKPHPQSVGYADCFTSPFPFWGRGWGWGKGAEDINIIFTYALTG